MGTELYWNVIIKKDDSKYFEDIELTESEEKILTSPRSPLKSIFAGSNSGGMPAIFTDSSDSYSYLGLQVIIDNLKDQKYYSLRKELLENSLKEGKKDHMLYEKIIETFESLKRHGNPDNIEVGLKIE